MLRRLFAVIILIVAAGLFIVFFLPLFFAWLVTGRNYMQAYIGRTGDIFYHLVEK